MGATEVATGVIDGLKNNPTMLAMIVINVIWLAAAGWFVAKVGERAATRDGLIMQLMQKKECS